MAENSLIHRDYIVMGAEIHIDMCDNRLEITSPGGMYKGRAVQEQDIESIESERRNPILADLFHRMRYMERRGSGLQKIVNETKDLPGYKDELKPRFHSDTSFRVIIYNVNYIDVGKDVGLNVGKDVGKDVGLCVGLGRFDQILNLIKENNTITAEEMAVIFKVTERTIDRDISSLKKQNKLKRIGSKKFGHWELQ